MEIAPKNALVQAVESKLAGISGLSSGYIESLPNAVKRRVAGLRQIHGDVEGLQDQMEREIRDLEIKYEKLFAPLYDRRRDIVVGNAEPTAEEVKEQAEFLESINLHEEGEEGDESEEAAKASEGGEKDVEQGTKDVPKGIPSFWLTCLRNNDMTNSMINDKDAEVLEYLQDIRCALIPDGFSFRLDFTFAPNGWFENAILTKTYIMKESDEVLDRSEGTNIKWKPGKNITIKVFKKKQTKKGKTRTLTKTEKCDSFFNFFDTPKLPDADEEVEEGEMDELQQFMEADYEVGMTFKENIIPDAISWFTGEAMEDEEEDEDEEDEDEEEGEEDEEDEEEEEDDGEGKGASGAKKVGAKEGEKPAECKQN